MSHPITPAGTVFNEDRLPLPGLYPVLTLQANLTMHQASGLGKFVVIVREPSDHQEISRLFSDLVPIPEVLRLARAAIELSVRDMDHLVGRRGI